MIFCTFSAGTFWGSTTLTTYLFHFVGVVVADKVAGGEVNPSVTFSMWSLGKFDFDQFMAKVSGQITGGILSFALAAKVADLLDLQRFGGPTLPKQSLLSGRDSIQVAFFDEFLATFLLCVVIYALNWEIKFFKNEVNNYYTKQSLTAVAIRLLIISFWSAGPAMNPMLASAFAIHSGNAMDSAHICVYWMASVLGAAVASMAYVVYSGGNTAFFGYSFKPSGGRDRNKPIFTPKDKKEKKKEKKENSADSDSSPSVPVSKPPPAAGKKSPKRSKSPKANPFKDMFKKNKDGKKED